VETTAHGGSISRKKPILEENLRSSSTYVLEVISGNISMYRTHFWKTSADWKDLLKTAANTERFPGNNIVHQ
jgi:hypothetical protein